MSKEAYKELVPAIAENQFPGCALRDIRNMVDQADARYYHGRGESVMSDEAYDCLRAELKRRAPDDPRLTRVGAPYAEYEILEKVRHQHPMKSLDKALTVSDAIAWLGGVKSRFSYVRTHLSFKMDGGSVSLAYSGGRLMRAVGHGDGFQGPDITANVAKMKHVPLNVDMADGTPFNGYVRGEMILRTDDWKLLDPEGESNARNLGNGISGRKSGVESEFLSLYAFRLYDLNGLPIGETEAEMFRLMKIMGFEIAPCFAAAPDVPDAEFIRYLHDLVAIGHPETGIAPLRETLPFEIDGLVISIDHAATQMAMGETAHHPCGQIALKFPPQGQTSVLREVEVSLGRTGALIPVGVFDPVRIGGVTVQRATLCNFNEIERLGICIGDKIRVTRRSDVIPKIESKVEDGVDRKPIEVPKVCPVTGGKVGHTTNVDGTLSVHIYSLSAHDSAPVKIARLLKWVSELGIQGLGEVYLLALYEAMYDPADEDANLGQVTPLVRLVERASDLYRLKGRNIEFIKDAKTGRMIIGPATMKSVIAEIEAKREVDLSVFLAGLGVPNLGLSKVQTIRQLMPGEFDTLNDWLSGKLILNADKLKIPNQAQRLSDHLQARKELITDLQAAGVTVIEKPTTTFGGMVFCLTGDFPHPKDYYHEIIVKHGHQWQQGFTKKTTHVVTMNPVAQTVKAKKARLAGLPVINPEQMMIILTESRVENEKPK